tara:strand:+ start:1014 stop:1871 length:858 start_codon:yes stop_codon:yes gene_type:complete
MAWALIVDGAINRTFGNADAFVHPTTGNQHPRRWLNLATDSELTAAGIIEITYTGTHKDSRYYTNTTSSPVYDADAGTVVITHGSTAKTLSTLQTSHSAKIKTRSNNLLTPTDWYVVRKAEASTAIPAKVTAHRTAVRTVYAAVKSAIAGAGDVDVLAALYVTSVGASSGTPLEVDGTSSDVVSTSNNTITSNGHGYVNDEIVKYEDEQDADKPIKGLVSGQNYYIINTATNTFKLSLTPSTFADEEVVSLTGVADAGTAHTFQSLGKPAVGVEWPGENDLAYKI